MQKKVRVTINHTKDMISEALGITQERGEEIIDDIRDHHNIVDKITRTMEYIFAKYDDNELLVALWGYGTLVGATLRRCQGCPMKPLAQMFAAMQEDEQGGN